jgi:integrase
MTPRQAEKQAAFEAKQFEDSIIRGISAVDGKIRFSEYTTIWRGNLRDLSRKTLDQYDYLLVRVNEALGNLRIESIQIHHIQAFIKNLTEAGIKGKARCTAKTELSKHMVETKYTRDKLATLAGVAPQTVGGVLRGKRIECESASKIAAALDMPVGKLFVEHDSVEQLSEKTIKHYYVLISTILKSAKREGIINRNPCEFIKPPKVKKREAQCLDDVQVREMVAMLFDEPDIRIKTSILLALCSGRRGELCGLEWRDIDFQRQMIHINRASQYQRSKGIMEVPTKNESSERAIKLPALMFDTLSQYREWWTEEKQKLIDLWQGEKDRLFIQFDGKPINPDTINFWLKQFIEKHNLPHFTPHSCRHTFSSLQLAAGVDIRTLQARTGHAQASTLVNTYSHVIKTAAEAASDILDDVLTPRKEPEE